MDTFINNTMFSNDNENGIPFLNTETVILEDNEGENINLTNETATTYPEDETDSLDSESESDKDEEELPN